MLLASPCMLLLAQILLMGIGSTKRAAPSDGIELMDLRREVDDLREKQSALVSPMNVTSLYNMDKAADRERLSADLWAGDYQSSIDSLRADNAPLVDTLYRQVSNQSKQTESLDASKGRLIDGILMSIARARSQKRVPLLTAATSILGEANHLTRELHDTISH